MAKPKNPKPAKGKTGHGIKSKPWYEDTEILRRLATVEDLVLGCYRNSEIASALNISEATVRRDRDRIAELWRKQATEDIRSMRERSIANYRRMQRLADNEFRNDREKPAMLRLQLDAEKEIMRLQGTPSPMQVSHDFNAAPADMQTMSSSELLKRASALEALANKLINDNPETMDLGG